MAVFRAAPPHGYRLTAATTDELPGGRFLIGCRVSHTDLVTAADAQYPTSPIDAGGPADELRGGAEVRSAYLGV